MSLVPRGSGSFGSVINEWQLFRAVAGWQRGGENHQHDKHVGNNFDAMRESVLCSNINHPNVVMTYKASLCCLSS